MHPLILLSYCLFHCLQSSTFCCFSKSILKNVSFTVPPGHTVALVSEFKLLVGQNHNPHFLKICVWNVMHFMLINVCCSFNCFWYHLSFFCNFLLCLIVFSSLRHATAVQIDNAKYCETYYHFLCCYLLDCRDIT